MDSFYMHSMLANRIYLFYFLLVKNNGLCKTYATKSKNKFDWLYAYKPEGHWHFPKLQVKPVIAGSQVITEQDELKPTTHLFKDIDQ